MRWLARTFYTLARIPVGAMGGFYGLLSVAGHGASCHSPTSS